MRKTEKTGANGDWQRAGWKREGAGEILKGVILVKKETERK